MFEFFRKLFVEPEQKVVRRVACGRGDDGFGMVNTLNLFSPSSIIALTGLTEPRSEVRDQKFDQTGQCDAATRTSSGDGWPAHVSSGQHHGRSDKGGCSAADGSGSGHGHDRGSGISSDSGTSDALSSCD